MVVMNAVGVNQGCTTVVVISATTVLQENTVTQHRLMSIKARAAQLVAQEGILPQPARLGLQLAQLVAQENTLPQPALPVI